MRYPGLKEEYYLADFEPNRSLLAELGVPEGEPLCVSRAPSYALYLGGSENDLLPPLRHLERQGCWMVVSPHARRSSARPCGGSASSG